MSTERKKQTENLVLGAILTAIVVVLQILGGFIKFGPFSVSLVLIPIVIGAAEMRAEESSPKARSATFQTIPKVSRADIYNRCRSRIIRTLSKRRYLYRNTEFMIKNRGVIGISDNAAVLSVAFYFILSLEISVP